jgi:manganese/zinc/iron transport system permease protein
MGDALSHATLPGIAAIFLWTGTKDLTWLITGAAASGILGVLAVIAIRRYSRIKEDAAIGIVLSVFFGVGMVLFSVIQQMHTGDAAGLTTFIYGQAAAMVRSDARLIGWTAGAVILGAVLLFKEFRLVCFDAQFAATQGWPVTGIDILMMALVVLTTVIGLQAVGLILIVAMLIIPAAAARFWTDDLSRMTLLAGIFGALSGWLGSMISALVERMPTGPIIVIVAGVFFLASMFFAPRRGLTAGMLRQWLLNRRVAYQNLLRALAEFEEHLGEGCRNKPLDLQSSRERPRVQENACSSVAAGRRRRERIGHGLSDGCRPRSG